MTISAASDDENDGRHIKIDLEEPHDAIDKVLFEGPIVPENRWLEQLLKNPPEILKENELREVISMLVEENNVASVSSPVTICGDVHGQFYDLVELLKVGGSPAKTKYIFLVSTMMNSSINQGDYVDRGHNSVETLQFLLILKLCYPTQVILLRGNHECRQVTQIYGFYDECLRKYGNASSWRQCTALFDYMTLAAVVDGKVFCVHGGLSPCIKTIDQLRLIDRVQEIPHDGPFGDIVWSDPEDIEGWAVNPRGQSCLCMDFSSGAGWLFGRHVVKQFSELNRIELIARAHQLAMDGYKQMFPPEHSLVTVWSAPNYCYRCGNVAAILRLEEDGSSRFIIFRDVRCVRLITLQFEQTEESRKTAMARTAVPYFM